MAGTYEMSGKYRKPRGTDYVRRPIIDLYELQVRLMENNSQDLYHDTRNRSPEGISPVLGVCVCTSKERRGRESGELELSTGCHARARSCDADVTTILLASMLFKKRRP